MEIYLQKIQELNQYIFIKNNAFAKRKINAIFCRLYELKQFEIINEIHVCFFRYVHPLYLSDRDNKFREQWNRKYFEDIRYKFFNYFYICFNNDNLEVCDLNNVNWQIKNHIKIIINDSKKQLLEALKNNNEVYKEKSDSLKEYIVGLI